MNIRGESNEGSTSNNFLKETGKRIVDYGKKVIANAINLFRSSPEDTSLENREAATLADADKSKEVEDEREDEEAKDEGEDEETEDEREDEEVDSEEKLKFSSDENSPNASDNENTDEKVKKLLEGLSETEIKELMKRFLENQDREVAEQETRQQETQQQEMQQQEMRSEAIKSCLKKVGLGILLPYAHNILEKGVRNYIKEKGFVDLCFSINMEVLHFAQILASVGVATCITVPVVSVTGSTALIIGGLLYSSKFLLALMGKYEIKGLGTEASDVILSTTFINMFKDGSQKLIKLNGKIILGLDIGKDVYNFCKVLKFMHSIGAGAPNPIPTNNSNAQEANNNSSDAIGDNL
ncbi:MAG: hypothetical protein LBI81_00855 [Puniceicoccales bacterium]|jgi:hypothetical protein|nr:hypothetical protein [Puniceicoccales bacterium]